MPIRRWKRIAERHLMFKVMDKVEAHIFGSNAYSMWCWVIWPCRQHEVCGLSYSLEQARRDANMKLDAILGGSENA
jgi:hypothetical protein